MPDPDRLALMLSTLCFLGAFAAAAYRVMVAPYRGTWPHHGLMLAGFIGQCWVLAIKGKELGRCPITQPWELLVFISWGVVMMYWLVGPAYRVSLMGIITAPLVWIFQLLAPNPAYRLPRGVLVMMLVWLLVCMSGLISMIGFGEIANAAHVGGLLIGCFTGLLGGLYNRRKLAA